MFSILTVELIESGTEWLEGQPIDFVSHLSQELSIALAGLFWFKIEGMEDIGKEENEYGEDEGDQHYPAISRIQVKLN